MRFKFTGDDGETFPTILHDNGTYVATPGDVIELDTDPGHARLEATDEPATITGARHADVEATHADEPAEALAAPVEPFATGGAVSAGTTHLVGERGPEIFNPNPDQE